MFEIFVAVVCFLLLGSVFVVLAILLVIKAVESVGTAVNEVHGAVGEAQERNWQQADAFERERMVRRACGWRVIGRVAGAGALITGAFVVTSPGLLFGCCLAALRMLRPIKQEMRDACAYKATGRGHEPS